MGIGRHAAHTLEVVEGNALALEQHTDVALDGGKVLAACHLVAVGDERVHGHGRVDKGKDARKHAEAGDHAVLLGNELHTAGTRLGHDGHRAHVAERHVLLERGANRRVHLCLNHRVHHRLSSLGQKGRGILSQNRANVNKGAGTPFLPGLLPRYSAPQRTATSVTSREPAMKRLRAPAAMASWAAVSAAKRSRMILSAAR